VALPAPLSAWLARWLRPVRLWPLRGKSSPETPSGTTSAGPGPDPPLGRRGEEAAAQYLVGRGYRILARGDQTRPGEIDIVALDGQTVVFVEVKTRRRQWFGHPVEAVGAIKQRRLTRLAVTFLKHHGLLECPARFDVIAVTWPQDASPPVIEHVPDAFEAVGRNEFYS
jgi:putative endonuclease